MSISPLDFDYRVPSSRAARYAVALGILAVATILRLALDGLVGDQIPFEVYLAAAVVAAWSSGTEAAVAFIVVASFLGDYLFVPPRHEFGPVGDDWIRMLSFAFLALVLVGLVRRWRASEARAHEKNAELEETLKALRASERLYRAIGESIDYGVWVCEPDGRNVFASDSFLRMVGMTQDECSNFGWGNVLHPDDAQRTIAAWKECVATGGTWDIEHTFRGADGQWHPVLARGVPVRDETGRIVCWVGLNLDISRLKQVEQELRSAVAERERALEELASANRAKDEFLSVLSHELRTPLNAILGWSNMLSRQILDPETTKQGLEALGRNARAQASLINDVLDVSRIVSGKFRLDVRPVELGGIIRDTIDAIRPAAEARQLTIGLSIEPELMVVGDPDRLQQVFWNLLSNSVKFTPTGGRVDVTARALDGQVEVAVHDTGTGIAPDFLPHVFERFRQADTTTTRPIQTGLGLGLAIVRHLAELHGGTVRAESPGEGQGATFTVTLPAASMAEAEVRAEEPGAPAVREPGPTALDGLHIVVVDDHDEARMLLETAFGRHGARVTSCASAAAGIETILSLRPDFVIADIGMPEMDGYEMMRRMRAIPSLAGGPPAVALTAYGAAEDRRRALDAGYQEHVTKPADPEDLVRLIVAMKRAPAPPPSYR